MLKKCPASDPAQPDTHRRDKKWSSFCLWHSDRDSSAFVGFAVQFEFPAVLLAHGFDIKQAEAETFHIVNIAGQRGKIYRTRASGALSGYR